MEAAAARGLSLAEMAGEIGLAASTLKRYYRPAIEAGAVRWHAELTGRIGVLAEVGTPNRDIADEVGLAVNTLKARFGPLIDHKRASMRTRLRTKQLELAMSGDRGMLIHLGNVLLGQRDGDGGVRELPTIHIVVEDPPAENYLPERQPPEDT